MYKKIVLGVGFYTILSFAIIGSIYSYNGLKKGVKKCLR